MLFIIAALFIITKNMLCYLTKNKLYRNREGSNIVISAIKLTLFSIKSLCK